MVNSDIDEEMEEELVPQPLKSNHEARIVAIQLEDVSKDASYSGGFKNKIYSISRILWWKLELVSFYTGVQ
jgi:hypothetical protein